MRMGLLHSQFVRLQPLKEVPRDESILSSGREAIVQKATVERLIAKALLSFLQHLKKIVGQSVPH